MNNNFEIIIIKKIIQKELLNELCCKGVIDFVNASNIIKKLEKDIGKLKNLQGNNKNLKNVIVKITIYKEEQYDNESVSN